MEIGLVQKGEPMTEEVIWAMEKDERDFWLGFNSAAMEVVEGNRRKGIEPPWEPPEWLREQVQAAIIQHDGAKWCQMQQLRKLFKL